MKSLIAVTVAAAESVITIINHDWNLWMLAFFPPWKFLLELRTLHLLASKTQLPPQSQLLCSFFTSSDFDAKVPVFGPVFGDASSCIRLPSCFVFAAFNFSEGFITQAFSIDS